MDINRFIASFSNVKTEDELNKALAAFSSAMGFNQFGLTVIIPQSLSRPLIAIFAHCSNGWEAIYRRDELLRRDPVIHLSLRQTSPIFWHQLQGKAPFLPQGAMDVMGLAAEFGLRNGVTFPLRAHGGESGILSFITSDEVSAHLLEASPLLRFVADYIFETAVRLVSKRAKGKSLTKREVECLFWASEGKTAAEIAKILGITTRTVTYYMHQAVVKTDSVNRDQAIAKAAIAGLLIPNLEQAKLEQSL